MDSTTIIISAIFLAVIITPIIITGYNRMNRKKRLLQSLKELADAQNCYITQSEVCNNFAFGLDGMANFLFFFKQMDGGSIAKTINLREYRKCLLNNSASHGKGQKESLHGFSRLNLTFLPKDKSKNEEVLEIYNNDYDQLTLTGELQVAERWSERIGLFFDQHSGS
jgi:hypothetical protein